METRLLYLFTRTPLHVGAGSSVGAIDQPVQRERHTGFPIIPGSSIKGVLRDRFQRDERLSSAVVELFGSDVESGSADVSGKGLSAGTLAFGEAKLLAFPVRSAKGSFALATSPLALERFKRDARLTDLQIPPSPGEMQCLAGERVVIERDGKKGVVLEEYKFSLAGSFPEELETALSGLLGDAVLAGAKGRFVLLSDTELSYFAINACQVSQHVRIDSTTGTAEDGGLFNEETVPSETLFYAPITVLGRGRTNNAVFERLSEEQLVQFGGGGTTGLGFCSVKLG